MKIRAARTACIATATLAIFGCASAQAQDGGPRIVRLSGASPFPESCLPQGPLAPLPPQDVLDSELNVAMAVDPRDPKHLIATWYSHPGQVIGAVVSWNAGASWQRFDVPITRCMGGQGAGTNRAEVSIDADGVSWYSAGPDDGGATTTFPTDLRRATTTLYPSVSTSQDGGRRWSAPVQVPLSTGRNAGPSSVSVDPRHPERGTYAWWRARDSIEDTGDVLSSSTEDGGRTWSPASIAYLATEPGALPLYPQVLRLPDGMLVCTFVLERTGNFIGIDLYKHEILAVRSSDEGRTWSAPSRIAYAPTLLPSDESGRQISAAPTSQSVVAPNGTIHAFWHLIEGPDRAQILTATSSDAGRTWSPPVAVATPRAQAFLPAAAARPDGELGVTWYDLRNDVAGDEEITTDLWIATSRDGTLWEERHVAGPFDISTAQFRNGVVEGSPDTGFELGDTFSLVPTRRGFGALFVASRPLAQIGTTDVFYADIPAGGS